MLVVYVRVYVNICKGMSLGIFVGILKGFCRDFLIHGFNAMIATVSFLQSCSQVELTEA